MLEPERLVGNIHKLQFPLRPIGYAARRFFLIPPKDQQAGFTQDIGRMLEKAAQPVLPVPSNGIERPVGKRSEEHTSTLHTLNRISYAALCLRNTKTLKQSPKIT